MIEKLNSLLFSMCYRSRLLNAVDKVFKEYSQPPFEYRKLGMDDAVSLAQLIERQPKDDLLYFQPHRFDLNSLQEQFKKSSFLMMGVFDGELLVGYFFLRFFANRKCFVGRLIDQKYRGKGMGWIMNDIMYHISWEMGFRCLSTISKNNKAVVGAHKKNSAMVVLKELQNDYLLVEFVKK